VITSCPGRRLGVTWPRPRHSELVELNPPGQYADDRNLHARQRLWQSQVPSFDIVAWVLDLAGLMPGAWVLDAGCGNGKYLRALRERRINAVGCDRSSGMLRAAAHPALINADVTALPVRDGAFGVVLAAHLLDLVPDRSTAIRELRRVLAPGGTCVAVTTGPQHLRSLRDLIERAVRLRTPDWMMGAHRLSVHAGERRGPAPRGFPGGDLRPSFYGRTGDHRGCGGGRGLREQPG
jgi:SAM-dependent methyltransferase